MHLKKFIMNKKTSNDNYHMKDYIRVKQMKKLYTEENGYQ